jgi:hypothetical protein
VTPAKRSRESKAARRRRDTRAEYARRKARASAAGTTVYQRRIARGRDIGLSRTQAAGHPRETERSARSLHAADVFTATFFAQPRDLITAQVSRSDAVRAGRYMAKLRALREGRLSPDAFRRSTSRMRPIAGLRVVSDPNKALALAILTEPGEYVFDSPRAGGRSRRR